MDYASVEILKEEIFRDLIFRPDGPGFAPRMPGGGRRRVSSRMPIRIGLGIAHTDEFGDYKLAVRVQDERFMADHALLAEIEERARGEVDVAFIGEVSAYSQSPKGMPLAKRIRPLAIGSSIAHCRLTAGSIGLFPWDSDRKRRLVLSNAHVLDDFTKNGSSAIYQPGPSDHGDATDTVGQLLSSYPIRFDGRDNYIDAAIAEIENGFDVAANVIADPVTSKNITIAGIGQVPKTGPIWRGRKKKVHKIGRSTCFTTGHVRSEGVDHITVRYGGGKSAVFNRCIEIVGENSKSPFSAPGDSGSVIIDEDGVAFGLLFSGAILKPWHSFLRVRVTYANDLITVFHAFRLPLDIA